MNATTASMAVASTSAASWISGEHWIDGRRPRVALISPWRPDPVDNGSKYRIKGIIDALAPVSELALISLLPEVELESVHLGTIPGISREWVLPLPTYCDRSVQALLAGLARMPRSFAVTWNHRIAQQVLEHAGEFGADLLIGTDLRIIRYLCSGVSHLPRVLDEANVSPFVADAYRTGAVGMNARARLRARKYRHLLTSVSNQLGAVVVSSAHEAAAYEALADRPPVTVIENSVTAVPNCPWEPPSSKRMLYTGSLTYDANADAVAYFQKAIQPLVLAREPRAELVITGAVPDRLPETVTFDRLTLTGRLESLEATIRSSRVFIAPLRRGTGTRIKILEALAYGMPVVTTSKGAEGLAVANLQHLLIADEPDEFAQAILRLLHDADFATELGRRGRALIEERYTWATQGIQVRNLVHNLLNDSV